MEGEIGQPILGRSRAIATVKRQSSSSLRSFPRSDLMRSTLLILALVTTFAASGSAAVNAQAIGNPETVVPSAPIGHLQPRSQQFYPESQADQTVEQKMSAFDAEQRKLDAELDKRLNICRC
jgi:hypothetical protein